MYPTKCPFCRNRRHFSTRGLTRIVEPTKRDGLIREALIATDYRWHCDECGKLFTKRVRASINEEAV